MKNVIMYKKWMQPCFAVKYLSESDFVKIYRRLSANETASMVPIVLSTLSHYSGSIDVPFKTFLVQIGRVCVKL